MNVFRQRIQAVLTHSISQDRNEIPVPIFRLKYQNTNFSVSKLVGEFAGRRQGTKCDNLCADGHSREIGRQPLNSISHQYSDPASLAEPKR
jgi:hypothetical protein